LATRADRRSAGGTRVSLAATGFEKALALLSGAMLLAVALSLAKGAGEWGRLPTIVWFHLATIGLALGLTPIILLRRRGDWWHRRIGYVWMAAVMVTAISTVWIRETNPGKLSVIHLLSLFTLVQLPRVIMAARRHDVTAHRRGIQLTVAGALLIAGFFTFMPGRILGNWLLG
jgi:uncharacterized membrane protein